MKTLRTILATLIVVDLLSGAFVSAAILGTLLAGNIINDRLEARDEREHEEFMAELNEINQCAGIARRNAN